MTSTSFYVCWEDGIPVHGFKGGWRHSLGGRTGSILVNRRHYPVPIERTLYDEAFSINVERARFFEIKAVADANRAAIAAKRGQA